MKRAVAIIATCDTKGVEAQYLRERIEALGVGTVVIDTGVLGKAETVVPDVARHEVAAAGGHTIEELIATGTRGIAVEGMRQGIGKIIGRLYAENRIHGALSIGGAEGSVLAAAAMAALPIGVPKLIVSPIASGNRKFGTLIGSKDTMVMHSVIDILGINVISSKVFDNAAAAIAGMVREAPDTAWPPGKRVAVSMLGTTTKPIMNIIKPKLEELGYEVVIFHANGVGGPAMDELIRQGVFRGVIDFTTNELAGGLFGGFHQCGTERMDAAAEAGVPQVVVPGGIDFIVFGPVGSVPTELKDRQFYRHNPEFTLVRVNEDEMAQLGRVFAAKLSKARGHTVFVYPRGGLSVPNNPKGTLWNPAADAAFLREFKANVGPNVMVFEVDAHINDDVFAEKVFSLFAGMLP